MMASFSELVRELAVDGLGARQGRRRDRRARAPRARAAVHRRPRTGRTSRDNLLQSYVAAREADLPVELVRERDGIRGEARLYLAPCAKLLTAPGIDRLRELAHGGATVYLSYFAGSTANQRGPWLAWLDEIFGVSHRLRYGLVDPIVDDEVVVRLRRGPRRDPGGHAALVPRRRRAERPGLPARGPGRCRGRRGRRLRPSRPPPARPRRRTDGPLHLPARAHGRADALGEPREHVADLLRRSPREAGVSRPVRVDDPRVLVGRVRSGGSDTIVFVNCSSDALVARADSHRRRAAGGRRLAADLSSRSASQ